MGSPREVDTSLRGGVRRRNASHGTAEVAAGLGSEAAGARSLTPSVDGAAPVAAVPVTGLLGNAGWYRSNVQVRPAATDAACARRYPSLPIAASFSCAASQAA